MAKMNFAKKKKDSNVKSEHQCKVLIVDDEEEVHNITKTVLRNFSFENKNIVFHSAYNGKDAIEFLKEHPDTALVLLDVVMETDDAGLIVAKRIREELHNKHIRIVLRTGQPGSAPEKDVIDNYDINDYKEKTELTSTKLYTTMISSLRSYRDLNIIERNKKGLQKVITASRSIFQVQSLILFTEGVLEQLVSVLNLSDALVPLKASDAFFATLQNGEFELLATAGKFKDEDSFNIITPLSLEHLNKAYEMESSYFEDDYYVAYFKANNGKNIFLYLEGCKKLDQSDKDFLNIFANNISIAFENICLNDEIIETQKEIVDRLGGVIENRCSDTADHVNRVAEVSYILAKGYGIDEEHAYKLKLASPMHDIGKIGIPDHILLKPGKLDKDEFEIIKNHVPIGENILKNSTREILKIAEIVVSQHHEKYDGTGYPKGLKGEDIHIYGRITAIADVFDALSFKRVYKDAWEYDKIIEFFHEQKAKHFDPKLIDIFFENIDRIKEIYNVK
ncbi:MAG: DUF3369 domain-containing protein [Campylobacterota bacterium]|nr:DUF3369 domain-containing protein [Campylobacterota bacterium]